MVCVRGPEAADGEDVRTSIRDFHCLESAKRSNEDGGWCFATFEDRCTQGLRAVCVAGNGGNVLAEGVSAPAREPARVRVRAGDNERDPDRERDRDLDRSDCACDSENERVCERDDVLSRSSSNTGSNPIDWAAASRSLSRSSSSSGGGGGGADISITSENRNDVGGGGRRLFLNLLRERENGSEMPEVRSILPRARLGRPERGLVCCDDGDVVDVEWTEGALGDVVDS